VGCTKYAIEMATGGMIYIPKFITICSGIQVILRLIPQQFERPQCRYYWLYGFMKYAVEMASGCMIYILYYFEYKTPSNLRHIQFLNNY
jgi:hypothetical protein